MPVTTEVIHEVWNDTDGVGIRIGPDSDGLGCIEIRPVNDKSAEWFGKFRLILDKEMTVRLAESMKNAVLHNP